MAEKVKVSLNGRVTVLYWKVGLKFCLLFFLTATFTLADVEVYPNEYDTSSWAGW